MHISPNNILLHQMKAPTEVNPRSTPLLCSKALDLQAPLQDSLLQGSILSNNEGSLNSRVSGTQKGSKEAEGGL